MITDQESFLDLIGAGEAQLVIPVYQRVYAWTERQCDTLYDDALRAGRTGRAHFIGTVLYARETEPRCSCERLDIIDGQQRAATITLILCALRDYLIENGIELEAISVEEITLRYLHVASKPDAPKLLLGRIDRGTMSAIVDKTDLPEGDDLSLTVTNAYERFRMKMRGFTAEDAERLWQGICRLYVVSAKLEDGDRAQLIFESLNSKGMPLTTADLVRNLLLVNIGYEEQTRLYETYWAPVEALYAADADGTRLAAAIRGWLAVTAPKLKTSGKNEVYPAFKTYLEDMHQGTVEELLIGLSGFCKMFAARSQATTTMRSLPHDSWGDGKVRGIISEKKLFGE